MKLRKILALMLVLAMMTVLFAGCGSKNTTAEKNDSQAETAETEAAPAEDAEEEAAPAEDAEEEATPAEDAEEEAAQPGAVESKTLRVLLEAEPETLDPVELARMATNVFSPYMTAMYLPLLNTDSDGNIVPGMIADWEWIDAQHLHITLQEGVVSRGGTTLTVSDLLYSFRNGLEGNAASYFSMFDLDNFEVEDDYNVILATNIPYPSLVEALLNPAYMLCAQADSEGLADRNDPADTCYGRYVFDEWVPGQYIKLVKNEDYFNPDDAGYYEEIICTFNSDASARALSLQSNDVDVAINLSLSQIPTLEDAGFTTNLRDTPDIMSLYLNCSRAPFDNEKVRQAISLLINHDAIRQVLYSGYGSVIAAPFSAATPYYKPYTGSVDIEGAKALLEEAGYPDGFRFTLVGLQNTSLAAEVIQANLSEAGITVDIGMSDFGGYVATRRSGDYDAFIGIGGGMDFANVLKGYDGRYSVTEAFGGVQYASDEMAYELIDNVYAELELAPRVEAMNELTDYLVGNGVMISLCSVARIDPNSPNVGGLTWHQAVFVDVSRMYAK